MTAAPPRRIVLASTSRYRAQLMSTLGIDFETVAPTFDERSLDGRFGELDTGELALELARRKASSVESGFENVLIVAGDQLAVLTGGGRDRLLHQPGTEARAIEQLMEMSGTTHELVNGLVVLDSATGEERSEVDRNRITMRRFDRPDAEAYVREYQPLDCAGGYRLEDDAGLVESVDGEHESGVIGLPLPALARLLGAFGVVVTLP